MLSNISNQFGFLNFVKSHHKFNDRFLIPAGIFLLFSTYGTSFQIVGQIRLTEIILIIIGVLNFKKVMQSLGRNELFLACLLLLTAFSYVFFDILNQGITHTTLKKVGSYCILAVLFLIVTWMVDKNKNRMLAAIIGFAFSFVLIWFFEIVIPNNEFHDTPWLLGLGENITVLALCIAAINPRYKLLTAIIFSVVILFHLFFGSRNLSLISLIIVFLLLFSYVFGGPKVREFTWRKLIKLGASIVAFLCFIFAVVSLLVVTNTLPTDVEKKLTRQVDKKYGVVITARPDVFASITGIVKKPLTGYGSGVIDDNIFENYALYYFGYNQKHYKKFISKKDIFESFPSHSHVFGAWLDAGFIAAISWIFILIFCTRSIVMLSYLQQPIVPLGLFYLLSMVWDILFSPGPNRVEMSIGLTFLFFIMKHLQQESQIYREN